MGSKPLSGAGSAPALQRLRSDYHSALAGLDLRRSRELILSAAEDGLGLGRVYADVVRPSLRAIAETAEAGGANSTGRLVTGSVRATLAVLASRPADGTSLRGSGRFALVSVGGEELDVLDGQVIQDVLTADGWSVGAFSPDAEPTDVAGLAATHRAQLVVMPTSRPADLLRSASTYTHLRRMADPPIIIACSFGHPDETRRARAAGADAFAADPDALLIELERRLPAHGTRAWGMQLRRKGDTLVVTPTGNLDGEGFTRLRAIVDSRVGSFERLIVDTTQLGDAEAHAVEDLVAWLRAAVADGHSHRVIPGDHVAALLGRPEPALLATVADAAR